MEFKDWNLIVSTISELSDIVPLIFLLFSHAANLRILTIYFLLSFLIKLTTIVIIFGFGSSNTHPFYHVLAIVEFVCLYSYFHNAIGWKKKSLWVVLTIVVLLNVVNAVYLQAFAYYPSEELGGLQDVFHKAILSFNSYAWSINTLILLCMSARYLYTLYLKADNVSIELHGGFIINAGFLIYFSGSLFIYLLGFSILSQKPESFFANAWIIQAIASLAKNIIVSYGVSRSNRAK